MLSFDDENNVLNYLSSDLFEAFGNGKIGLPVLSLSNRNTSFVTKEECLYPIEEAELCRYVNDGGSLPSEWACSKQACCNTLSNNTWEDFESGFRAALFCSKDRSVLVFAGTDRDFLDRVKDSEIII